MVMTTAIRRAASMLVAGLALQIFAGPSVSAQSVVDRIVPTNEVVITGYGTVGYLYRPQGSNQNEFATSFNPILLFQFMDRVLFEAELEFALQGGVTETGLEYAQIDAMVHDNLILVGGKFLLPFGVFGERLHPTWINKFATAPPIYGHHVSEFGADPILPILSDIGVMARAMLRPGNVNIALIGYLTQGPAFEALDENGEEIPEIEFPGSSSDVNTDKLLGGRLDISLPPVIEVNVSYFNADYDTDNVLDLTAWNVAAEFRVRDFELRGEYVQTRQEIEQPDGFPELRRHGFYAQAAYRWRRWEPVFRWTQVFDDHLNGEVSDNGARQAAFGLNYWFSPSIALMAGYELNREDGLEIDNDRIVAHVAFGF